MSKVTHRHAKLDLDIPYLNIFAGRRYLLRFTIRLIVPQNKMQPTTPPLLAVPYSVPETELIANRTEFRAYSHPLFRRFNLR